MYLEIEYRFQKRSSNKKNQIFAWTWISCSKVFPVQIEAYESDSLEKSWAAIYVLLLVE